MIYENMCPGTFLDRPNRFIAHVELLGNRETVHVKNTGRCRELLVSGAEVWCQESRNPARKTKWDLICVRKGAYLVNMDSQAPNQAVKEWLEKEVYFKNITYLKPECKYGNSRVDFYLETADERKIFIEVKGVTLEEEGVARFPDAPTLRGIKHMKELEQAVQQGYEAYILFVIQMKGIKWFEPNDRTHPEFGDTLRWVSKNGVGVLAYDCSITKESMELDMPVEVRL